MMKIVKKLKGGSLSKTVVIDNGKKLLVRINKTSFINLLQK